jgi:glycosyltransferase involved in cell wall biosynthesis
MKVLFVCSGNSHYGIVPFIKSQGESLKKEGVLIDYFTIKGNGVIGYLKNIKSLRQHISKNKYDIIHAHYGLIGILCLLTFSRRPIVLSVMGSDIYGFFNNSGKREKSSYYIMFLTQISLIFVKQIIVKSNNILSMVPYKNKSHIIPNGVDFEIFNSSSIILNQNIVLSLANPRDHRKNYSLVQEAMDFLDEGNLKLVNPFPISHNQLPEYFNNASVFVLTSYNEGSPNVIKEAMACNIPIVSTDVGDVKEVIGKTEGCYITSFSPEDVADKIMQATKFGKRTKGRENIKHLESSVIANKIINIYEKILRK